MTCRLRVMIDARMLIGRFSGVGRVVTQLVDELARQNGIKVVALCGCEAYRPWIGRDDIEVVTSSFGRRDRTACRRVHWEEVSLPRIIRRADVDVFHATWNSGVPALCPVPSVLTIHDLIPWRSPRSHFASVTQRWCHRYAVRASARRAFRVTTVSEYTRRQVVDMLNVRPERVVSIPNGVTVPVDGTVQPDPSARPYALYVGGFEPRKNIGAVFSAMTCYWQRHDPTLELRLTGHARSLSGEAAEAYRALPDRAPVRFLGNVDDEELGRQYASAKVLLMLSRDEGFGLPVLEAMAYGCPVVAAANAALPEVVGDAGVLVDPEDSEHVSEVMRLLIADPRRRSECIHRGRRRVSGFGWDAAAARARELYEQAVSRRGRSSTRSARFGHTDAAEPMIATDASRCARRQTPTPSPLDTVS